MGQPFRDGEMPAVAGQFTTTHWSVVLAAAEPASESGREALAVLCRKYWYPLYAYLRRQGHDPEQAQDLTQSFFARLLEKNYVALAAAERGRFRTFLLTALKNFVVNDWRREHREKRGGGEAVLSLDELAAEERFAAEPAVTLDPEKLYEKRWALTLLEHVLARLREDYAAGGRGALFDALRDYLWGEKSSVSYAEAGVSLGLSEGAVKVAVHRLRLRYRELLRGEIANTVAAPAEIDDELRHLAGVISSG